MPIPVTKAAPVISLEDAKEHLKIDWTDEDAYLTKAIASVTVALEQRTGRTIGVRTWEHRIHSDDVCCRYDIRLPSPPLIEVISFSYRDAQGTTQTYSPINYVVYGVGDERGGGISVKSGASWPYLDTGPEVIRIQYRAGYAEIPEDLQAAAKLLLTQLFAHRGEMVNANMMEDPSIKSLVSAYRIYGV